MIGLVLGGGDCVWEDEKAARELVGDFDAVAAVNDMISLWPGHLDYACTLHIEKMAEWLKTRHYKGLNRPQVWTHKRSNHADMFTSDWQGSSGLFAVKVLLEEGFQKVIVAGVPMDPRVSHVARKKPWGAAPSYHIGWTRNFALMQPHVRSMSGWTKSLLSAPTKEWVESSPERARMKQPVLRVAGMHGMGDNIHQRAIIRQLMERNIVVLESSWVSLYHDLIKQGLFVTHKRTTLRTQTKNSRRELSRFSKTVPQTNRNILLHYSADEVRRYGSVLGAMCTHADVSAEIADFRLPIPDEWRNRALVWLAQHNRTGKPLMLFRPIAERTEWSATMRNPRPEQYAKLYESVRDAFFVVSIADLEPSKEWLVPVQPAKKADVEVHHGEFEFEMLAAMFKQARLVFASPGFAVPLAQSVQTPLVCVFGGYENRSSFSIGERWSKWLPIQPIRQCSCFQHTCPCDKRIDMEPALAALREFVTKNCDVSPLALPSVPQHPKGENGIPSRHIGSTTV